MYRLFILIPLLFNSYLYSRCIEEIKKIDSIKTECNFIVGLNDTIKSIEGDCRSSTPYFDFFTRGKRVCYIESTYDKNKNINKIIFLETNNNNQPYTINRRLANERNWTTIATNVPPGTKEFIDENVSKGVIYEYQVRRKATWEYKGITYDAIGYTSTSTYADRSGYRGQMILLMSDDVAKLTEEIKVLKRDLTGDGWFVNELIMPRAQGWDSKGEVVEIRKKIKNIYDAAPIGDKPRVIFILGHVPLPRSGGNAIPPDEHDENKGARGFDGYYADIDGIYTDNMTYNPGGLSTPLAINLPNDYKWDQDYFSSDVEMGYSRVDFADLTEPNKEESELYKVYLKKLHNYKIKADGFDMGVKSALNIGYDNSTDGAFRTLPSISRESNTLQYTGTDPHPKWVKDNGPFLLYLQNLVIPEYSEWKQYGMDAVVHTSDQSYYGFGDVPQNNSVYSRIRSILSLENRNMATIWSTTAINIFPLMGTGECLGEAIKRASIHNDQNKYYERPEQEFDDKFFWARTHLTSYGDPTIRFYQVPVVKISGLKNDGNNIILEWNKSSDANVIRYDIYESDEEFGQYKFIASSGFTAHILPNYKKGKWYMIKAITEQVTGSGIFINSSIGSFIQGSIDITSNVNETNSNQLKIFPNPTNGIIEVKSNFNIDKVFIFTTNGQCLKIAEGLSETISIDLTDIGSGMYIVSTLNKKGEFFSRMLVKE